MSNEKQKLNHFGKKAQVHELCRKTRNLGHECGDDKEEIHKVNTEDLKESISKLAPKREFSKTNQEILLSFYATEM